MKIKKMTLATTAVTAALALSACGGGEATGSAGQAPPAPTSSAAWAELAEAALEVALEHPGYVQERVEEGWEILEHHKFAPNSLAIAAACP